MHERGSKLELVVHTVVSNSYTLIAWLQEFTQGVSSYKGSISDSTVVDTAGTLTGYSGHTISHAQSHALVACRLLALGLTEMLCWIVSSPTQPTVKSAQAPFTQYRECAQLSSTPLAVWL